MAAGGNGKVRWFRTESLTEAHQSIAKSEANSWAHRAHRACANSCARPWTFSKEMRWENSAALDVQWTTPPKLPRGVLCHMCYVTYVVLCRGMWHCVKCKHSLTPCDFSCELSQLSGWEQDPFRFFSPLSLFHPASPWKVQNCSRNLRTKDNKWTTSGQQRA